MSTQVGAVGAIMTSGGPPAAKSLVEATLVENAKQQRIAEAPLKIPDARRLFEMYG
jgi:hypothetical protein